MVQYSGHGLNSRQVVRYSDHHLNSRLFILHITNCKEMLVLYRIPDRSAWTLSIILTEYRHRHASGPVLTNILLHLCSSEYFARSFCPTLFFVLILYDTKPIFSIFFHFFHIQGHSSLRSWRKKMNWWLRKTWLQIDIMSPNNCGTLQGKIS